MSFIQALDNLNTTELEPWEFRWLLYPNLTLQCIKKIYGVYESLNLFRTPACPNAKVFKYVCSYLPEFSWAQG